jgi:uncharacterized membrane protein
MAVSLAGFVAVRLLLNPAVLSYPIGEGILLNWLLYGYGIPIIAFAAGAVLFRRLGGERTADVLESGAIVFGIALVALQIRQAFHPGDLGATRIDLAECSALTISGLLYGLGLMQLHSATGRRLHMMFGGAISALALLQGIGVQGLLRNPLFHPDHVGSTVVFNTILFAFGIPALLGVLLARSFARIGENSVARLFGSGSLILAFLTLSLEVRQAFHGSVLSGGGVSNAEMYTYSLVWILFGTALLVTGIVTRGAVLRYGSAVVMLIAVGKVFLFDTAHLEDLYRVFSLFGLGVSLMVLAYLYQRFVFGEKGDAALQRRP